MALESFYRLRVEELGFEFVFGEEEGERERAAARTVFEEGVILAGAPLFQAFESESERLAVLAREVGHMEKEREKNENPNETEEERMQKEFEADEFAVMVMGKESVNASLLRLLENAQKMHESEAEPEGFEKLESELRARIEKMKTSQAAHDPEMRRAFERLVRPFLQESERFYLENPQRFPTRFERLAETMPEPKQSAEDAVVAAQAFAAGKEILFAVGESAEEPVFPYKKRIIVTERFFGMTPGEKIVSYARALAKGELEEGASEAQIDYRAAAVCGKKLLIEAIEKETFRQKMALKKSPRSEEAKFALSRLDERRSLLAIADVNESLTGKHIRAALAAFAELADAEKRRKANASRAQ